MAECCHRYRAYQQKKVYLDQADRLSIILSELPRYKDDADAYRTKIVNIRKTKTTSSRLQNEPPKTPKRNQETALFTGTLKNRFARESVEVESRDEQFQSSREVRKNESAGTATNGVVFKESDVQVTAEKKSMDDKSTSILRTPLSMDQSDESASGTIPKMVSLAKNHSESFLTETTYI